MNEWQKALAELTALQKALEKAPIVEAVWVEYPAHLSVQFVGTAEANLTIGFAEIDENTEAPIRERMVFHEYDDEGRLVAEGDFAFIFGNHTATAEGFFEAVLNAVKIENN
jgi:hypothetical protein